MPGDLTPSERVRAKLDHPVVDADGHFLEFHPALNSYLREEGVEPAEAFGSGLSLGTGTFGYTSLSHEERLRRRATRTPWWAAPAANTLDLATATLPGLLYERLDQMGIDFAVLYPSAGLLYPHVRDEATRRAACRALNRYSSDSFGEFSHRLTPAAAIPMHSPDEAIETLEHAVEVLGLKAAMIAGFVERDVAEPGEYSVWWDTFGIDSTMDYDPFWRRCVELGVSVGSHSGGMGIGFRRSLTNYMHNHIGHFAAVGEALAKSLFLGGVTRRFPKLRVGLLEGGVHWGVGLYGDLIGRWEKRNPEAVQSYNPKHIDHEELARLVKRYGGSMLNRVEDEAAGSPSWANDGPWDDFSGLEISGPEDVRDLFVSSFYFGCEADDPMTPSAFDTHRIPLGARINAMFSSDIGHWDVPEMTDVLHEAHENVDHGWLDEDQFQDFVFGNVARFYTDTNPDFFSGTVVEREVKELISKA
ncbi:amidohydrolase [Myxococcota bacterium]|nr:amidohydrolase [Myxococcota bacterium]